RALSRRPSKRRAAVAHRAQPGGQRAGPPRRRDTRPALRLRSTRRDASEADLRRADDGGLLAASSPGEPAPRRAVSARRRAMGGISTAKRRLLRPVSVVAPESARGLGAPADRDHPDRQSHGAETDGGGGLRSGALAGEQRRRGAAHGHVTLDANR